MDAPVVGRGWRAASAGLLLIGVVTLALPFHAGLRSISVACGTPARTAFAPRNSGIGGTVFIDGTDVGPFPRAAFCQHEARQRLLIGAVLVAGGIAAAVQRRRLTRRRRPTAAGPPRRDSE